MTVTIDPTARIEVDDLTIGDGTIIRAHAEIYGRKVTLGRECFIDEYAVIGGGSAEVGELVAGDWLHMGMWSQINTARRVTVGDEVGVGIGTRIFTHGAYLSEWDGFPVSFADVTIGSRVWLPQATVLPGVTIGDDVVVAAGSVVVGDLDGGVLAGGVPARVIRKDAYPNVPENRKALLACIAQSAGTMGWIADDDSICCASADFYLDFPGYGRRIVGYRTEDSERLKNELRRHGIRFPYSPSPGGLYVEWEDR